MGTLSLEAAEMIVQAARAKGRELKLKPLTVAVLDAGGHLKAMAREDGSSTMRPDIAFGKANGAIAMGLGSRALFNRVQEQPYFIHSMTTLARGALVPVPGGVLIRDRGGEIIGAVGITGDSSDNDEACAIVGIEAAGLVPDAG
ncbi:MAG: heme-binding protein [Proteobacteria bacterium]|nr:heme-binding protein [Pseudomonadota bacterium]